MAKKHNAPPGCDYSPISGDNPNVSYGTVEAGSSKTKRTLADVICKRLFPVDRPTGAVESWPTPTCHRHEILLPRGASDHLAHIPTLIREYHAHNGEMINHLATVITLRFPEADAVPAHLKLHELWELARGYGRKLSDELSIAVLPILHVPAHNWGLGFPHVHLVCPVRVLRPASGFSTFVMQLINGDEGRAYVDTGWREWRERAGSSD